MAFENLYMYGPTEGVPLTEDLPYDATGLKGRTRARMAQDLMEAHRAGKVRVAIGRASDYFGPRGLLTAMGERVNSSCDAPGLAALASACDQSAAPGSAPERANNTKSPASRTLAPGNASSWTISPIRTNNRSAGPVCARRTKFSG